MRLESPIAAAQPGDAAHTVRPRDASHTRQQLLEAARKRFAFDGYDATTVRDIATDAGVNVALINRYFESKEGLFKACLTSIGEQLERPASQASGVDQIARGMVAQLVSLTADGNPTPLYLLLLLRRSGDPQAESIRVEIIRSFAERIAAAAGWRQGDDGAALILLRAEVALATTLGVVLLRTASNLEPLASADEAELFEPMRDVVAALLSTP
jgi:AcrR family transcriptional regulator